MSLFNIQQLRGDYRKKWFGSKNQNFDVFFENFTKIAAVTFKKYSESRVRAQNQRFCKCYTNLS